VKIGKRLKLRVSFLFFKLPQYDFLNRQGAKSAKGLEQIELGGRVLISALISFLLF
jgi:hypothetical protein